MITVGMIEKHARPYMRKIARDVKSAKLRGWVPQEWPTTRPIPLPVREKLTQEFDATNNRPTEIEGYEEGQRGIGA